MWLHIGTTLIAAEIRRRLQVFLFWASLVLSLTIFFVHKALISTFFYCEQHSSILGLIVLIEVNTVTITVCKNNSSTKDFDTHKSTKIKKIFFLEKQRNKTDKIAAGKSKQTSRLNLGCASESCHESFKANIFGINNW